MKITVSNILKIEAAPAVLANAAILDLTLPNPEFVTRQRMNKWLGDTPEVLTLAEWNGDVLILPRGYLETLITRAREKGVPCEVIDARLCLPALGIELTKPLRSYQIEALETMKNHGSGIVVAPCGSGKTVIGMALIAHWKQPALVLVHTKESDTPGRAGGLIL